MVGNHDDAAHGFGRIDPQLGLAALESQSLGPFEIFQGARKIFAERLGHAAGEHDVGIIARQVERAGEGRNGIRPATLVHGIQAVGIGREGLRGEGGERRSGTEETDHGQERC